MTDAEQQRDVRSQIESLSREVYSDGYDSFLATPRRSLGDETPAALIERGDLEPVLQVLFNAHNGHFG